MWWYRDSKRSPGARKPEPARPQPPAPAPSAGPAGLAGAVARALDGADGDDACVVMALLVDSRIELDGGAVTDGMSWLQAERTIAAARPADPPRLYNRFARDFGDGWTARADLSDADRARLGRLRDALAAAPGVKAVGPRSQPAAAR